MEHSSASTVESMGIMLTLAHNSPMAKGKAREHTGAMAKAKEHTNLQCRMMTDHGMRNHGKIQHHGASPPQPTKHGAQFL